MVARLTPDQKVACSIHVGFNTQIRSFYFLFSLYCVLKEIVIFVQKYEYFCRPRFRYHNSILLKKVGDLGRAWVLGLSSNMNRLLL